MPHAGRKGHAVRVAQAVGEQLAELGVEQLFGVIGSGNLAVTNALRAAGARFVHARHECAAVSMADGYARVSGRLGVASVHQGPGLTNTATALTEAAKARTPLLLLAADTSAAAVRSNFRIDQAGLVRAVGAAVERIHTPASAPADVARAHRRAIVDRRAVALMLPLDIQGAELPAGTAPLPASPSPYAPAPDEDAVTALADLLMSARRPVILAGRGAVLAGAGDPLRRLADATGALLATSANGNGLFTGDPYALGISGGFATPLAARLLAEADVVVAFGASLNSWTTRHGTLPGTDTRVAQVDLEVDALGAERDVDVAVVGDAARTAHALLAELRRRRHRSPGYRTDGLAAEIAADGWRSQSYDDAATDEWIDPRTLSIALDELLPAERTLAIDSGHFMGWPAMYLGVPDAAGFVFTQSFQSIGLGLSSALGAAVARPDRLTVAALGDGGALMALGELDTLARLGLPVLVVVYDDAAYGAEVHHFAPQGEQVDLVRFADADLAALARAAGLEGTTVRRPGDLDVVADWLDRRDGPLVVDAKIHPDVRAEWLEEAFRAH